MNSYSNQNVLMKYKQRCEQQGKISVRLSNESHLYWKKHFYKNPLKFMIIAHFEADNEIDNSNICKKTSNVFKQNPVCNG